MPLVPVLFVVFLVLKLTGIIAWSWLWVTAPLWIPFALALTAFGLGFIGVTVGTGIFAAFNNK